MSAESNLRQVCFGQYTAQSPGLHYLQTEVKRGVPQAPLQLRHDCPGTGVRPWEPLLGPWWVSHAVVSVKTLRTLYKLSTGELDQVAGSVLALMAVPAPALVCSCTS